MNRVMQEAWCEKCDGPTKHVKLEQRSMAVRPIDGDRMLVRTPILMCMECWTKQVVTAGPSTS